MKISRLYFLIIILFSCTDNYSKQKIWNWNEILEKQVFLDSKRYSAEFNLDTVYSLDSVQLSCLNQEKLLKTHQNISDYVLELYFLDYE